MSLDGYILTCPCCGYEAPAGEFDPSCADECECPKCGASFIANVEDEEDEETL